MPKNSFVRINLGCGLQCPEGWINIDSSLGVRLAKWPVLKRVMYAVIPSSWGVLPNMKWPANVRWMNITKKFSFPDNSVDVVYSSHTIEHLSYEEASFVFRESYRVLRTNGIIRIIVPDLEVIVADYVSNKTVNPERAAKKFLHDTYLFEVPIPHTWIGLLKFSFRRKNNHHFLYDAAGLEYQLEQAGFRDIKRMGYGESSIDGVGEIDIPSRFNGALCLEARK